MAQAEHDGLILKTAPSRLISLHLYLLSFILAGISGAMSLGYIPFDLPGIGASFLVPLIMAIVALFIFFYVELKRITRRYMVYENRVARREGILSKRIQYMPYTKVERVELNQSILKRIFGIGDIIIDTGEDSIVLEAIRNPARVEAIVSERLVALKPLRPAA